MLLKIHRWYAGKIDKLLAFVKSFLTKEKSDLEKTIDKIDQLESLKFNGINSSSNSLLSVDSQFKHLTVCNEELKNLHIHVKGKKVVYDSLYVEPSTVVNVSVFFLSEKNTYIDEAASIEIFKQRIKNYLELFDQLQTSPDPVDVRNHLHLSGFTSRLKHTLDSLLELQDSAN